LKDVLETLERWIAEGLRVATATVIRTERSAPRDPGAVLAVSEKGEVAGSVTGGCVEPAVYEEAQAVLAGGPPKLLKYGIADEEAFEVGLPCGGTVHIFVDALDPALVAPIAKAVRAEQPVALAIRMTGEHAGEKTLVYPESSENGEVAEKARALLRKGQTGVVTAGEDEVFVSAFAPRPRMYIFGAIDFASALASLGRFVGYHVTVCDARAKFATPERFPDVDELVVDWPDRFLERAPIDERTVICCLTHDNKFDVPILKAAVRSPAGYIGAMGSRRTTERREERLREEGVTDEELARIHAPIGLPIGSRSPEEVAVAIVAEIVSVFNASAPRVSAKAAAS
jgi:xanthine dehydrogenase accessory factor